MNTQRNERFGRLLSEGISSVARRQGRTLQEVETAIGEGLGYARATVDGWRRGTIPRTAEQVAYLARYCVTQGRMDHSWAASLLLQAAHPTPDTVLKELFPPGRGGGFMPAVRDNLPARYGAFLGRQADVAQVLAGIDSR